MKIGFLVHMVDLGGYYHSDAKQGTEQSPGNTLTRCVSAYSL